MEEIKTGDIVYLKSDYGGQKFTVGGESTSTTVIIYWFDYGNKDLKSEKINKNSLIKSNES